ncbi:MAG: hypothetical protein IPN86_16720 [Saprospiraceae bacterium]|nr:hypothetical protein [Saprospiraceae bacterium]
MSIINKLNANLLIDFVQKSCTLSWLLPYAGGSYFFALPKKEITQNEGTDLNLNQLGVMSFILDLTGSLSHAIFFCHKYFIFNPLTYLNKISFLTTLWFEMTKADKEKREMKGVRPRRTPFISYPTLILGHFEGVLATEKPLF